jgi:hypothetical protein
MQVELGNDRRYLVTRFDSISFYMLAGEVLELHEVLYITSVTKNLLSNSYLTY